eukprot:10357596-Alexandrium_andersonii.AAC.1
MGIAGLAMIVGGFGDTLYERDTEAIGSAIAKRGKTDYSMKIVTEYCYTPRALRVRGQSRIAKIAARIA